MAKRPNRVAEPGSLTPPMLAAFGLFVGLFMLAATIVGASALGARIEGVPWSRDIRTSWTLSATIITCTVIALLLVLTLLIVIAVRRTERTSTRVDRAARFMATPKDMKALSTQSAQTTASRLGVKQATQYPGTPLGVMVNGGHAVYSTWEMVRIAIMGPRAGKTMSVAIREVMETPGPVVATSNKRDLVDATRGPRSERGRVYVFDVQKIIGEPPTWWWNPLSYATTVERSEELVDIFKSAVTNADARSDAYFDGAATKALSALVLAAHLGDMPISTVLEWVQKPDNDEPVVILMEKGFTQVARSLFTQTQLTEKQRDGVFGIAGEWVSFLRNPDILRWVQRDGDSDTRPHFDPTHFATSTDSLYLVSREGAGSARALTAALAMATLDAADKEGSRRPGMRLPNPLAAVLDEAANVVRWPALPDLFSHYGSRGIILSVFLQSWSQGIDAWGERGMAKMWSAANTRLLGAGIAEPGFLRDCSDLIGERDMITTSTSRSKGSRSTSRSVKREKILTADELQALPQGRAILFSSGNPATIIKLVSCLSQDYGPKITASTKYYEGIATR